MYLLQVPIINRTLERFGIFCRWRASMVLDLHRLTERPTLPSGYEIMEWDSACLAEVARVDYLAYRDTLDARLYWEYFSSPAGCERMWKEAVTGKFGRFDPQRTLLLMHGGEICGDVMASIRKPGEAFIGNLAVLPEHRGGLGRALLLECLWRYRNAGFQRVSLAVTLENERAFRLYTQLGFVVDARFPLIARPANTHLSSQTSR